MTKEIKVLELERRLTSKTHERFEKGPGSNVERLKTIERELGQSDEDSEVKELSDKIKPRA